jgi:carbon storage regulator
MLVLTRRPGQTIVIDGAISVTVMAVMGGKVRLGVTAPPSVRVDRSEVHDRRPVPGPARLMPVGPSAPDEE